MVRGECFTSLDDYKREEWPEIFAEIPKKGDWIEAKSKKRLKAISITHCERRLLDGEKGNEISDFYTAFIRIELYKNIIMAD